MSSSVKQVVTVGDKVKLEKDLTGTVQYIGEILQRKGIYYGIALDSAKGKTNGQVGNIRYFQCKNKYGLFLRFSRIQKVIPNKRIHRIGVNDLVEIYINNSQHIGIIRYIGIPYGYHDIYYGIEFEHPISNNDGIFHNVRYFSSKKNCAYFIKASNKYINKVIYKPSITKSNKNNANNKPSITKSNTLKLPNTNTQIKSVANNKHHNGHVSVITAQEIELKIHFEIKDASFSIKILSNFSYKNLRKLIKDSGHVSNIFEIRFEPKIKQKDRKYIERKINLVMTEQQLNLLRLYSYKFYEMGKFYIIDPLMNGIAFEDKGEYELALKTYEKAIMSNSKCVQVLIYYANCLVLLERFDKAEEIYKRAININPFCGEVLHLYTRLLEYRQKYKQIEKLCENIGKRKKISLISSTVYEPINYKCLARLNLKYIQLTNNCQKYIQLNEKVELLQEQILKTERIIKNKNKQLIKSQNEINLLKDKINKKETRMEVPSFEEREVEEDNNNILLEYMPLFRNIFEKKKQFNIRCDYLFDQLLQCKKMKLISECKTDSERQLLMKNKLELCAVKCDFSNIKYEKCIGYKKDLLLEVLQSMSSNKWNDLQLLTECINTISINLFRSLPSADMIKTDMNDDEMDFRDPSWEHLQLIYELTFHVVTNTHIDKKTMKKYLQGKFLENLICLFSSTDDREPQYVKIIVHAIYGRFMALRKSIRKYLSVYCYKYIYLSKLKDVTSWQGLPEILEIFCSIFQGLNIPVKKEYYFVLKNVIIPLHKSFHLDEFHEQLLQCCTQFVTKNPEITCDILAGILKFWPVISPLKEQLFITEIIHILNVYIRHPNIKQQQFNSEFDVIIIKILNKFIECISSVHHQVAERALMVWRDETIRMFIDMPKYKQQIWPNIIGALKDNNKGYWLPAIRDINRQIIIDFKKRDAQLFQQIENELWEQVKNNISVEKSKLEKKELHMKKWNKLKLLAKQNKNELNNNNNGIDGSDEGNETQR